MTKDQESTATRAALNLLSAVLIGCSGTTDPGDTTPPAVTSTSPVNASVGVLINSVVTITFSEAMMPSTISASSVTVVPTSGGVAVPGSVTYDSPTRTATFSPTFELLYNSPYTITVTTGARDVAGNQLASNFTSTFQSTQYVFSVPYFRGTTTIANDTQPHIHVHVKFTQDGHVL